MVHDGRMKLSPVVKSIKSEMERQELNPVTLAGMAGVAFSHVYKVLDGEAQPSLEVVEKLAKALRLTVVAE